MGNVASRTDEGAALYVRDQTRLSVTSVKIINSRNKLLYTILPNSHPASRYTIHRASEDDGPIEYVQDTDFSTSTGFPNFLLRLDNDQDLYFYFTFAMRPSPSTSQPNASASNLLATDTAIKGLTFVFASNPRDLDTLVTREFNADPNLHRNPNVDLVGDYSTDGSPFEQFEWSWKWRPPRTTEDKGGGWRNSCSFVEYDQRAHRLNTLVTFSFWVNNQQRRLHSPKTPQPKSELLTPPRLRLSSTQSIDSKLSDSDTDTNANTAKEMRDAAATPIDVIPEASPSLEHSVSANSANAVKVDLTCQNAEDDISLTDDGPLFRATIKSLESKTGSVRQRMKKVLKKAEAAKESQVASNATIASFIESLREAALSNGSAVQPVVEHYFEKIAKDLLAYEKQNAENLQKLIIEPLSKIYGNEIKQADAKKKDFDEESRDYYAYVSRYLGQRQDSLREKKRAESDTKYENKRRTFELKRFDYSSFMQDLHGGRRDHEVLSQLTKYADAQAKGFLATAKKVDSMLPQLDALAYEVKEADKQYQLLRTEREEKRRYLEKTQRNQADQELSSSAAAAFDSESAIASSAPSSTTMAERPKSGIPTGANGLLSTAAAEGASTASPQPRAVSSTMSPNVDRSSKAPGTFESRDHGDAKGTTHKKEGLLWSLSRPGSHADPKGLNKQAWHKYWVVLDQGRLSEYVNWKGSAMEQHMGPIDLRVASVREARNQERRFTFEVITPHYTRVYQAISEEDMRTWVYAINNALQSAFETRDQSQDATSSSPTTGKSSGGGGAGSLAQNLFGKSSSYHGHRSASSNITSKSVNRHISADSHHSHGSPGHRPQMSHAYSSEETHRQSRQSHALLQRLRDADAGNAWCADCGSNSRVEWVSINLGIIVCIECSGIHRSLGTHISKMRSLTLDTNSFTQDIVELLLSLGNRVANMVWEGTLNSTGSETSSQPQKPTPNASRDQRAAFITAKYAQQAFVRPIEQGVSHYHTRDEMLLASIKKGDIQNVAYALALKANPNAADRSRNTHAVFLALAAADPAQPGSTTHAQGAGAAPIDVRAPRKSFAIAELLLQNGAELPTQSAPFPLSKNGSQFLEFKKQQRLGRLGVNPMGGAMSTSNNSLMSGAATGASNDSGSISGSAPGSPTKIKSPASSGSGLDGSATDMAGGRLNGSTRDASNDTRRPMSAGDEVAVGGLGGRDATRTPSKLSKRASAGNSVARHFARGMGAGNQQG